MSGPVPPRIYCISALDAPIIAVFRRGPADWSHVGRWDVASLSYEPGAWLSGRIFPRRCDLSPDGRFLCYFAHKPSAKWAIGDAYVAVSKLPWLTALHAFPTCGTWTRGYCFTDDLQAQEVPGLPPSYRLQSIPAVQFATERRRGWQEAPDSPPRGASDAWDVRRNARLQKRQPGGHAQLRVESIGYAGGELRADQAIDGLRVQYSLETDGELTLLDDLQWADWDRDGRLLVVTRTGKLQVRRPGCEPGQILFEHDVSQLEPNPVQAPRWATHW